MAGRLAGSAVVKALNHIGYHELEDRARPAGAPDRRASGLAGDDPAAVAAVAELTDRIGYDPVRLGGLPAGRVLQPGGPVFGQVLTVPEFERAVHQDARSLVTLTYTFGLDTFGDRESRADGTPLSHAQTIRNVVEEGVFAEQAGVDFFGIGEHHTDYFPMPAGDVALAAIAARTEKIRLGSAVTVLSSDDPVRVFQRYSTLNAVSGGRAEVILGRGSSIESFPLFGYDLADYEELFDEKATLFAELLKGGPVTWEGKTRAALLSQDVVPHLESGPFPAWIGVGGNPQSVIRAARLGFSLALAIIGGPPSRFAAYSELFGRALEKFGQPSRPVLVHSPGHVAATDEQAKAEFWPAWREVIALVAEERGFAIPTEASFDAEAGPGRGAVRRLAGDRGQQDRRERARPGRHQVRPEVRPAGPDPRSAHDHHRAVRPAGRPAGARTARLTPVRESAGRLGRAGRVTAQRPPGSGARAGAAGRGCWPRPP